MNLFAIGCSHRSTPVAVRERLAFSDEALARALDAVTVRFGCEAVILSTCNRVELYLAQAPERPLSPEELQAMRDGCGVHTELIPGTFIPVRNKDNDYMIDRAAQKARITFSGISGVANQDCAMQENIFPPCKILMKAGRDFDERGEPPVDPDIAPGRFHDTAENF